MDYSFASFFRLVRGSETRFGGGNLALGSDLADYPRSPKNIISAHLKDTPRDPGIVTSASMGKANLNYLVPSANVALLTSVGCVSP